jgi:hypothetical protein
LRAAQLAAGAGRVGGAQLFDFGAKVGVTVERVRETAAAVAAATKVTGAPSRSRRRNAGRTGCGLLGTAPGGFDQRVGLAGIDGVFAGDGFEHGDDAFEVSCHASVVGGQAGVAVAFGEVDLFEGVVALTAVQRQELGRGLEVQAVAVCSRSAPRNETAAGVTRRGGHGGPPLVGSRPSEHGQAYPSLRMGPSV